MYTNVKKYTDEQIWDKVISTGAKLPLKGKLIVIAIQSNENAVNRFDDKFYGYIGQGRGKLPKFLWVTSGTTHTGLSGLLGAFTKYNKNGVFIWKTNKYYTDCFKAGFHNGKMKAFRLNRKVWYYRDNDLDTIPEEQGKAYYGNKNTHLHSVSYNRFARFVKKYINGWSLGCQVLNDTNFYYNVLIKKYWAKGVKMDFGIFKEWKT